MPVYSQRIAATRSLSDAPLGTVFLPGRVEPDIITDDLLAALPAGAIFLDPRSGFSAADGRWTDRKSGQVFRLGTNPGAAMPVLQQNIQGDQPGLHYQNGTSGCPLVSDADNIWPIGGSYTSVLLFKATGEGAATGGFMCNRRIESSQTGGVQTGASRLGYVVSGSVIALNHQTRTSAGATTANLIQPATGTFTGTMAQMLMTSFDGAADTGEMFRNGVSVRTATGLTRDNEEGHLVIGAAGYIPGEVFNPLRYVHLLGAMFLPGLALHAAGSAQAEIKLAIETYARNKLAIW